MEAVNYANNIDFSIINTPHSSPSQSYRTPQPCKTEKENEGPLLNSDANNVQSKSSNSIDLNIVPMSGDGANSQQPINGEGNQSQLSDLNDLPSIEMDFDMSVDKEEDGMPDDTEDASLHG